MSDTQPKNVSAFINKYGRLGSPEQDSAFWREFRKAANAYADTQAHRLQEMEQKLKKVTEQRDRLAEAMFRIRALLYGETEIRDESDARDAAISVLEEALAAVKGAEAQKPPAIPDILFDGFAVYSELNPREKHYTTPENVSAVLDAIVRIMRWDQQALAAVKGADQ